MTDNLSLENCMGRLVLKDGAFRLRMRSCGFYCLLVTVFGVISAEAVSELRQMTSVTVDTAKPELRFMAAENSLVIASPVRILREVSSVQTFVIEDGPEVVDVSFNAGILESGGVCGLVKEGKGTLRVAGEVRLSGFITVYAGVLDLSEVSPFSLLRIHLMGDSKLIPPQIDAGAIELYVNGLKLAPGRWNATDSAALMGAVQVADSGASRREIWKGLKYGIFSHYMWNGYGMTPGVPKADGSVIQNIDELADAFDVSNYVNQVVEAGAQYVVFTAWHSGTCPLFPSAAMAKWAPDRSSCPKRDLLGELLDECRKRGVRAFFYCHPYQPVADPHNDWINDLFAELVDRYGERLDGLWIDENFQDCTQDKVVDYRRLMRTIKARNPDLVLTQNNGGYQTYGVDEGVQEIQWEYHEGRMNSTYQIFSQTAKSPEDMLITTVIQAAANTFGGGIQWSIDAHGAGVGTRGGLDASARPMLDRFAKLLGPIAESVKNSRPSSSFPPPFSGAVVKLANLSWGVATKSHDDTREYLHVLKPPADRSLTLPPPTDGKVFARARLLDGGHELSLSQSHRGLVIKLPDGVDWSAIDTVIVMDVIASGGVGLVNNTSLSFSYLGASWEYLHAGVGGEFRGDSHRTTADGDSFNFVFDGTDIEWISSAGTDRGPVEILIDGVSQGIRDLSKGDGTGVTVFAKCGLPRGRHTFTAIKRGGGVMVVDAFKVSDLINNSDPSWVFSNTTRHSARAAVLEGLWEPRGNSWINGSSFTYTFHGTSVAVFGGAVHGGGDLVLAFNGQAHSTVRCQGGQNGKALFSIEGLPDQVHTLVGHFTNPDPSGFIPELEAFSITRPDYWFYKGDRERGELGNDAHLSSVMGATGNFTFDGSGVEILTTLDPESRTVHYTLDGGSSSLWVGMNQYAPVTISGASVFGYRNLNPGRYKVGFTNAANHSGENFSKVELAIDGLRVYKGQSSSASPWFWGADGRGGPGTWSVGGISNWNDGAGATPWLDFGGMDYSAVFSGSGGMVDVVSRVRVHRLVFRSNGYRLRGESIELTGEQPTIHVSDSVIARLSLAVCISGAPPLAAGSYTSASHPDLITGAGELVIEPVE